MATLQNLSVDMGTDKTLNFTVYSGSIAPANKLNLTGYSAEFLISNTLTTKAIIRLTSSPANGIVIAPNVGLITVNIAHSATTSLSFQGDKYLGYYQLKLIFPDGTIKRLYEGGITIPREIKIA